MKYINLTKGYRAKVDDEWFGRLSIHRWCCVMGAGRKPYAVRARKRMDGPGSSLIYMHRVIAGATEDQQADHRNGRTMDCQSDNLRPATQAQNNQNAKARTHYAGNPVASRYKGVAFGRNRGKKCWVSKICIHGVVIHLGWFETPQEGARAYNRAAVKHFGSFARLNEVPAR